MAIGMSYDEFWRSNPKIANIYSKAQHKKIEILDAANWSLGAYFYEAVYASIGKFFGGESFTADYPEKPRMDTSITSEELQRRREEREIQRMIAEEERQIVMLRNMGLPKSNSGNEGG